MDGSKYRILVVDDEQDLCEIFKFNFEANDYSVDTANSAEEALAKDITSYNLLLLDIGLGGMSGLELAKQLKRDPKTAHVPIIFITAKNTENDTVTGFNFGADDYISKPFSIREVMVRVRAVLRRSPDNSPQISQSIISYNGLEMNLDTMRVSIDGKEIAFTKTEFGLLRILLGERGKVVSRQDLINRVWPKGTYVLDRTVDVNITRLRKKIGRFSKLIITRPGFGYYFAK